MVYGYDPRVCFIEDRYYVTWCNGYHGPTIGVAYTFDFETFHQLENAFIPFNRNGVLFPRKINGRFAMLSRPSDNGHTPFGDIYYSESPDLEFWGRHRHVMSPAPFEQSAWQCLKIGAGPIPIETSEGWLLFYHGVLRYLQWFMSMPLDRHCLILDRALEGEVPFRDLISSLRVNLTNVWVMCPMYASLVRLCIVRQRGRVCRLLWLCRYGDRSGIRLYS